MKTEIIGKEKLFTKLDRLSTGVVDNVNGEVVVQAKLLESQLKRLINSGSRSGRVYVVNGNRSQRSGKGEPPKSDTGRLASSINTKTSKLGKSIVSSVGTKLKYGRMLEFGTINMAPRPWLFPTFKKNIKPITKAINLAVRKATKRAVV